MPREGVQDPSGSPTLALRTQPLGPSFAALTGALQGPWSRKKHGSQESNQNPYRIRAPQAPTSPSET